MSHSKLEYTIASLRDNVSRHFGQRLETSTDFSRLADEIVASKAGYVSASTLKRYWGYVKDNYSSRRLTTLDILARFAGYNDFSHYAASIEAPEGVDSDYNSAMSLDVQTLRPDARLAISWHPDRKIIVVYHGNLTFTVEQSVNSRLTVGEKIKCMTMVKGQPLILNVISPDNPLSQSVYIAGKKHGIDWKIL